MEKELVRHLGELIGYGNMMQLASECWKESMTEKGYPTSGVFIPALPCDVRGQNDETSENSLHKHIVMPPLLFNWRQRRKDLGFTLRKVEESTGISNAYLSQLENGKIKSPSYNTIRKLVMFYRNGA